MFENSKSFFFGILMLQKEVAIQALKVIRRGCSTSLKSYRKRLQYKTKKLQEKIAVQDLKVTRRDCSTRLTIY